MVLPVSSVTTRVTSLKVPFEPEPNITEACTLLVLQDHCCWFTNIASAPWDVCHRLWQVTIKGIFTFHSAWAGAERLAKVIWYKSCFLHNQSIYIDLIDFCFCSSRLMSSSAWLRLKTASSKHPYFLCVVSHGYSWKIILNSIFCHHLTSQDNLFDLKFIQMKSLQSTEVSITIRISTSKFLCVSCRIPTQVSLLQHLSQGRLHVLAFWESVHEFGNSCISEVAFCLATTTPDWNSPTYCKA